MEIKVKTLTPLWTGGPEAGKCDRIHETGILGSLRWWMEALVRGLGGQAIDPTAEGDRSGLDLNKFDAKTYRQFQTESERRHYLRNAGLCDVSQIFGATGWKRQFRLSVSVEDESWQPSVPLRITPQGRTRGWYLNPGWLGTITLTLRGDSETLAKLHTLLHFIEAYGSLGARPQLGYGVFRIASIVSDAPEIKPHCFCYDESDRQAIGEFPDLQTFTFFKLQFTPRDSTKWWQNVPGLKELRTNRESFTELEKLAKRGMFPITPALKNYFRYQLQWSSPTLPHWLFGTIRHDERQRSKIAFSWAYHLENTDEWEIRGWMYLPPDRNGRIFKREIVSAFQDKLGKPQVWLNALGLQATDYRTAKSILFPNQNPWQIHSISEVQALLDNALTGKQL